jgi:hypothetical protein
MVQFALGNDGKYTNEEYHIFREEALRNTYSIREWGDIDIEKYDLDNLQFSGKDNPRTYKFDHSVSDDEVSVTGFDVRNLPTHD